MKLPGGATLIPVILSSNKTELTTFFGYTDYPLYLTIGNIERSFRRKLSHYAQILIGYLPTPNLDHLPEAAARALRARIFHAVMKLIMKPLTTARRDGVELTGGDGTRRHCYPILACYVPDYLEQALVTCTRAGRCPVCSVTGDKLGEHGCNCTGCRPREQAATLKTITRALKLPTAKATVEVLKEHGLTNIPDPF